MLTITVDALCCLQDEAARCLRGIVKSCGTGQMAEMTHLPPCRSNSSTEGGRTRPFTKVTLFFCYTDGPSNFMGNRGIHSFES